MDIATDVIDRIHTTAGSHSRVMCIEVMGNKAGWLTLYSGIAGGADIILIPEHPYDIKKVAEAVMRRQRAGKNFSILAVAICVPGHMQRGGSPSAYDRVLATQFGTYAARLVADDHFGVTVAMVNNHVTANPLVDIAGKTRGVPDDCDMLNVARSMGISLG